MTVEPTLTRSVRPMVLPSSRECFLVKWRKVAGPTKWKRVTAASTLLLSSGVRCLSGALGTGSRRPTGTDRILSLCSAKVNLTCRLTSLFTLTTLLS